jgi:hypothetical protein
MPRPRPPPGRSGGVIGGRPPARCPAAGELQQARLAGQAAVAVGEQGPAGAGHESRRPQRGRAAPGRLTDPPGFRAAALPPGTFPGHYQASPQDGRRELIVEPVMAAVVTALIGAAGTVLAAWVQARARHQPRRERSRPGRGGRGRQDRNSGPAGAPPR